MTLTKAIEFHKLYLKRSSSLPRGDLLDAFQLGLEALTRFKALRDAGLLPGTQWLPSETPGGASS